MENIHTHTHTHTQIPLISKCDRILNKKMCALTCTRMHAYTHMNRGTHRHIHIFIIRLLFFLKYCSPLLVSMHSLNATSYPHRSTDLKPFACSLCEKAFKQKQHLDRHLQCHSGELHTLHTVKPVHGGHP